MQNDFQMVLFDLGGVLVDFDMVSPMVELSGGKLTAGEVRAFWGGSSRLSELEAGRCDEFAFATGVIKDLKLEVGVDEFLSSFKDWDHGFYPGAFDLLSSLKRRQKIACLSNNNEVHWRELCRKYHADMMFHNCFISCRMKLLKPDRRIFDTVCETLSISAGKILFFDDNPANVAGAKNAGLEAFCVKGITELHHRIEEFGI